MLKNGIQKLTVSAVIGLLVWETAAFEMIVPPPRGVSITVYDTGQGLVRERRAVSVVQGENLLQFRGIPDHMNPFSVAFSPPPRVTGIEPVQGQFAYDLAKSTDLFARYTGEKIVVQTAETTWTGSLLRVEGMPLEKDSTAVLTMTRDDGSLMEFFMPGQVQHITFPRALDMAYLEPTYLWKVRSRSETMQNIRMSYVTKGLSWQAGYELVLARNSTKGRFSGRFRISNHSGADFGKAAVRLVATEKGVTDMTQNRNIDVRRPRQTGSQPLRYTYSRENVTFEAWVGNLSPLYIYPVSSALELNKGTTLYTEFISAEDVGVNRFFVYDGVKFDRFQRNRRNDWNYGTEGHHVVEAYLDFQNTPENGLGTDLAPGIFRLYQEQRDGSVDLIGEDYLNVTPSNEVGQIRLGPARGLWGERERTGYTEIVPLHEYEESFEIRLENNSSEDVEVRVVEHLYRWHDFDIVRADTEYKQTGPQTVEFRPRLKAGGRRSVHYTVLYRW